MLYYARMPKPIFKISKTTNRRDLLGIMQDSYLFPNLKAARYSLGATATAIRAWMIAMSANPPAEVQSRLTIPGVGTIRIGWYEHADGARRVKLKFSPCNKVREQLRRHNRSVPGTEGRQE